MAATDLRRYLQAAIQPPATNPLSDENLPGATSVTVKFDPDGTYKQNVVGRFAPVKQLAQSLSQAPRKSQNFGALGPEQILKATQMFNQTGANRQGALDSVARLASQLQGADTAARAQLLAEHKANNPDLVMTHEGVALPRSEMREYLLGKTKQRADAGDARAQLALKMLGHEEVDLPKTRAYVGERATRSAANRDLSALRRTQAVGQNLENQSFYPVTRGDNKAMMSTRWEKIGRGGAGSKNLDYDAFNEQFGFLTKTKKGKDVVPRTDLTDNEVRIFNKAWAPFGAGAKRVIVPEADAGKNVPLVYPTVADMPPLGQAVELGKQLVGIEATYPAMAEVFKREGFDDDTIIGALLQLGIDPREFEAALPGSKESVAQKRSTERRLRNIQEGFH